AAQESPVKYDMISLYIAKLGSLMSLDKRHPLIPRLLEQINRWVEMQPEINRQYWQEQIATIARGEGPPPPREPPHHQGRLLWILTRVDSSNYKRQLIACGRRQLSLAPSLGHRATRDLDPLASPGLPLFWR